MNKWIFDIGRYGGHFRQAKKYNISQEVGKYTIFYFWNLEIVNLAIEPLKVEKRERIPKYIITTWEGFNTRYE